MYKHKVIRISLHCMFFSHKDMKDTCYTMDAPWRPSANWKHLVKEDHLLYDSIYMECQIWANLYRQEVNLWLFKVGGGRSAGVILNYFSLVLFTVSISLLIFSVNWDIILFIFVGPLSLLSISSLSVYKRVVLKSLSHESNAWASSGKTYVSFHFIHMNRLYFPPASYHL